jgi:tRNA pseudouridine55 synthase
VASRREVAGPDGFALVDKEAGWTSHDVVARSRGSLGTRKVGHAGTLDPDATGLLVLGVGRATRLLKYLTGVDKRYTAEVVLGVATSTLDASGEVVAEHDMQHVTLDDARRAAATLTGDLEQIPPMVSAIKVAGRRLHELARSGVEIERSPRTVHVARFDVHESPEPGVLQIDVECSSGTYVRSLAADLGGALGGSAHLRQLRRLRVGAFSVDDAVALDALTPEALLPPSRVLPESAHATVDAETAADIAHGRVLARSDLGASGDGPWAIVDEAGDLLAVYEPHRGDTVKPGVVFPHR